MPEPRYRGVNIDIETHARLESLAQAGYRSVPAEVRFLVENEEKQGLLVDACRAWQEWYRFIDEHVPGEGTTPLWVTDHLKSLRLRARDKTEQALEVLEGVAAVA